MKISEVIEKYISAITDDKFHRYRSWDQCFQAFGSFPKSDYQVLELAFYLASWGMYRGSSGLLQKNHLIHRGAVEILLSDISQQLRCSTEHESTVDDINAILKVKSQLANHYKSIYFSKGLNHPKSITPTDTLLSKVMLGTLGCVPAYDRYFIVGLLEMKMVHNSFTKASLLELFTFIYTHKHEIEKSQHLILKKTGHHYPIMKIIDMYFWQIGYDKEIAGK